MQIDISTFLNGSVGGFIGCLILKLLLDFNLGQWFIKYFWWIPVRNYIRAKPLQLSGLWDQQWQAESTSFSAEIDRHSNVVLKQIGTHCYGEFTSKRVKYCIFGRIESGFFIGNWYDAADELGYFGMFELRIIDTRNLAGRWMGHSKKSNEVKHGEWDWEKVE